MQKSVDLLLEEEKLRIGYKQSTRRKLPVFRGFHHERHCHDRNYQRPFIYESSDVGLWGYLIICCTLLLGHLLGAVIDKRIDCLFSIGAIIMFIASGVIVLDRWTNELLQSQDLNALKGAGSFMLITALIFFADTFVIGIAIACIVLWETSGALSSRPLIVCGTMGGFTIICGVLLVGHILNSIVEKRLNALMSILGCVLFVISGALIIDEWHDNSNFLFKDRKRNALAAGSLMIINGAVFLLDTLSICRTRREIPIIKEVSKNAYDLNRY